MSLLTSLRSRLPPVRLLLPAKDVPAEPGAALDLLLEDLEREVRDHRTAVARAHPKHRDDAVNLLHYLALRRRDRRPLQRQLADRGLSSLGRCEPYVLATVTSARQALVAVGTGGQLASAGPEFDAGRAALDRNTDALLGPRPARRVTRIMVTLPSEAARDATVVARLVGRGMDVARINAAHDGPEAWRAMAAHVRAAADEAGRHVLVSVDLAGPKLRTGPFVEGPRVLRLSPARDVRGIPTAPATGRLTAYPGGAGGDVPVGADWLARRRPGDVVTLVDTRGGHRRLEIEETGEAGCAISVWDTTYLETGQALEVAGDVTEVGELPCVEPGHRLRIGDLLTLTADLAPVQPWSPGSPGRARIGCSLPELFAAVAPGHRVLLDDGKLETVVTAVAGEVCELRVVAARPGGTRLRAEKGINVPDTDLPLPPLSADDDVALRVAAEVADIVAMSFVRGADDVDAVRERLAELGAEDLGLLAKIENRSGFERLPEILLHVLRSRRAGIMIARGDLAVEMGYERLAEVQEEILWLCEAARLPVVWATQVLDQLARTGRPSRAEVTDAAMAQRAECVMLNKGPHIEEAISVLDDILRRMGGHQRKKTAMLRPLHAWYLTGEGVGV